MEPPQTEEFVTWNKHSIYNCVELCIPDNPVLLSKLVYSFKEINNSFYKLTWDIRISVSGIQFFLIWHVPCWPLLIDKGGQISQNNYRFTSKHQKYKFSTWGHCNCLNGDIHNMTFQFRCTLCEDEGHICLCTNTVFGVFLRTFGHLIRRFVLIL